MPSFPSETPGAMLDDRPLCSATVLMLDDRWGGITAHCELPDGHVGAHSHRMTACVPLACLRWGYD